MSVKNIITVTNRGISPILSIAQGTDSVEFDFTVTDYDIPPDSSAVVYNVQPTGNVVNQLCSISGNTISVTPRAYFFLRGKNYMQFRITCNGKNLFSFLIEVWCSPNITEVEVSEVQDPTVVTQVLSKLGDVSLKIDEVDTRLDNKIDSVDSRLGNRINNIVANNNPTEGNSELIDIRSGFDGTTYPSAGEAIRQQVGSLSEDITKRTKKLTYIFDITQNGYLNINNTIADTENAKNSGYINAKGYSKIYVKTKISDAGYAIAFIDDENNVLPGSVIGNGNTMEISMEIPLKTKKIIISQYAYNEAYAYMYNDGSYDEMIESNKQNILKLENRFDTLDIKTSITDIFDGINLFNYNESLYYNDRFPTNEGTISTESETNSIVFKVEPNKRYFIEIPGYNRVSIVGNTNEEFTLHQTYEKLSYYIDQDIIEFYTKDNTNYVMLYFYHGVYDYENDKKNIYLDVNYWHDKKISLKQSVLPIKNRLLNKNILVFGDSISDCCYFSIDENDRTSKYSFADPSNSYVNSDGTTIKFDMWPKLLNDLCDPTELRNYAKAGATYKNASREEDAKRQNLSYQIEVALNDLCNPNGVFNQPQFDPDIIIFALGINDGEPNDTYEEAMDKTIYKDDGVSVDIEQTLYNLDLSKFNESVRYAFLKIKYHFPMAQIFVVLPIQKANMPTWFGTMHDTLEKMAKKYSCIIIDGAYESGINSDLEVANGPGVYLKDGLHPNEKGQNLMFRLILSKLLEKYLDFDGMNAI